MITHTGGCMHLDEITSHSDNIQQFDPSETKSFQRNFRQWKMERHFKQLIVVILLSKGHFYQLLI